jgi:hypothetical protein
VSFFDLPARLADGLEAKNLLLYFSDAPQFRLTQNFWFPRAVFITESDFGDLVLSIFTKLKRKRQVFF